MSSSAGGAIGSAQPGSYGRRGGSGLWAWSSRIGPPQRLPAGCDADVVDADRGDHALPGSGPSRAVSTVAFTYGLRLGEVPSAKLISAAKCSVHDHDAPRGSLRTPGSVGAEQHNPHDHSATARRGGVTRPPPTASKKATRHLADGWGTHSGMSAPSARVRDTVAIEASARHQDGEGVCTLGNRRGLPQRGGIAVSAGVPGPTPSQPAVPV